MSGLASGIGTGGVACFGFRRRRRDFAIGWVDNQPRLTPLNHVEIDLPPVLRGMKRSGETINGLLLSSELDCRQLVAFDVFKLPARKLIGSLQRSAVLAQV